MKIKSRYVLAEEIVENLEVGLESFQQLVISLNKKS